MEHRLRQRIQTHLKILIHHGAPPETVAVVRNLTPDGAFLEFADGEYKPGTVVTVEFTEATLDGLRLDTFVIHATDRGIGVMFKQHNPRLAEFYAARAILSYRNSAVG